MKKNTDDNEFECQVTFNTELLSKWQLFFSGPISCPAPHSKSSQALSNLGLRLRKNVIHLWWFPRLASLTVPLDTSDVAAAADDDFDGRGCTAFSFSDSSLWQRPGLRRGKKPRLRSRLKPVGLARRDSLNEINFSD